MQQVEGDAVELVKGKAQFGSTWKVYQTAGCIRIDIYQGEN